MGSEKLPNNDPHRANLIWARSPEDPHHFICLVAPPSVIRPMQDDHMNAAIGQFCGLIHGNIVLPMNGTAPAPSTVGLVGAHALYRGLRRPLIEYGRDSDFYAYTMNPPRSYIYPIQDRNKGLGPVAVEKPKDSVFVTYVDFAQETLDRHMADMQLNDDSDVRGVIPWWEWVPASGEEPFLPEDYGTRYGEEVWRL